MRAFLLGLLTVIFAVTVVIFLSSCAGTLAQRRAQREVITATLCAVAVETCTSGRLHPSEIADIACEIIMDACEEGTVPDTSESMIETSDGTLIHGMLPGVFRCPVGEDCRLANKAANYWNLQFKRQFGDSFPNVALVGPSGWITISEDDLPPHAKGSVADLDNSNEGLMRGPTLLGVTDYGHVDGLIHTAHITLRRGAWRDVDLYHEAGHALFGLRNRGPSLDRANIMSTPPWEGFGLTRSDAFAVLERCIFID